MVTYDSSKNVTNVWLTVMAVNYGTRWLPPKLYGANNLSMTEVLLNTTWVDHIADSRAL
jgi:hypothetical protein